MTTLPKKGSNPWKQINELQNSVTNDGSEINSSTDQIQSPTTI